jgi:O-antigen ligase
MNSPGPKLEKLAVLHAGAMVLFATWALGGAVAWARTGLCLGGSLGVVLTLLAVRQKLAEENRSLRTLHWLWPLAGFNVVVLLSLLHPSFRETVVEGASVLVPVPSAVVGPTTARPGATLAELWLFNALFLPCFNLAFFVRQSRLLWSLLIVVFSNAVLLAIFGTLQKLLRAPGLYLGAVRSPNPKFFSTFVYQNHWGSFAILTVSVGLGLVFVEQRRTVSRDFWHSPAFAALTGTLLIAVTVPLSGSRACTLLVAGMLVAAFGHGLRVIAGERRAGGQSAGVPLAALIAAAVVAAGSTLWLAEPVIKARAADTVHQYSEMRERGTIGSRAQLYADTWHMAREHLSFGWGLGSYPTVFTLFNTQESSVDRLPVYYADAHSDWLQSIAEVGVVGSACRGLLLLLPLIAAARRRGRSTLSAYLLSGCTVLLLYALIEFPLGNPAVKFTFFLCFFCAIRLVMLRGGEETP